MGAQFRDDHCDVRKREQALLGVQYRPKAPIAITETLAKTLSERETPLLEKFIAENST